MHKSFGFEDFVFDCHIQRHVDVHFHSEKNGECDSSFYMHYENDFVSPDLLMKNSDVFGETNENDTSSLPPGDVNKNYVFDRGKRF